MSSAENNWTECDYEPLRLHPLIKEQLRFQINHLFSTMAEQTRENYYKLCEHFYLKIRDENL